MTLLGTGIDIVNNNRFRSLLAKNKAPFKRKIFTKKEISYCDKKLNSVNLYSKRYAAKEACSKALGIGLIKGIFWKDLEVVNDKYGKPYFVISNKTKNKIKKIFKVNNFNIFLSMSDEKKYSIASVIISK